MPPELPTPELMFNAEACLHDLEVAESALRILGPPNIAEISKSQPHA